MASERLSSYAARLGFPDSDIMLEILELLFPEGAERAVFEALGKPATLDEIIVKTGLSRQEAEKATSYLYRTGAIARYLEPQDKFKLFGAMIELRDATAVDPDAPNRLFQLWERLITEDLKRSFRYGNRLISRPYCAPYPLKRRYRYRVLSWISIPLAKSSSRRK